MAAINADIKPNGVNQGNVVDLIYQLTSSLVGLAAKLDADDAAVSTYASGINAILNCEVADSKGNVTRKHGTASSTVGPFVSIKPTGLTNDALLEWMYQWTAALYSICYTLDNSAGVALTTYIANAYTAIMTDRIVNRRGQSIGAGTTGVVTFNAVDKQGGAFVDWLYDAVNAVETLTELLDLDATLTDTNYEALWFTNNITLTVENNAGNRVGN